MKLRQVKSFVLRGGKITAGQQRALNNLLPLYGIEYTPEPIDLNQAFQRNNQKIVEIGFGMGKATSQIALTNPDFDYLGIEVHAPGVGSLLMDIEQYNISNLKIIKYDAVAVIKNMLPDTSIYGFHIFFPDPWHKRRHHKRRIIQVEFINLLCSKLQQGGYIHLATDWEDYATWMLDILNNNPQLINSSVSGDYIQRPQTKFEQRGLRLGHKVWDVIFTLDRFQTQNISGHK